VSSWLGVRIRRPMHLDTRCHQLKNLSMSSRGGVHAKLRVLPDEARVVGDVDGRPSGEREQAAIDRVRPRVPDRASAGCWISGASTAVSPSRFARNQAPCCSTSIGHGRVSRGARARMRRRRGSHEPRAAPIAAPRRPVAAACRSRMSRRTCAEARRALAPRSVHHATRPTACRVRA
jgi:hypothetical protein